MLVPAGVLDSGGAVATEWTITCPVCQSDSVFHYITYVNLTKWPDFVQALHQRQVDETQCECGEKYAFPSSLIVEIPRRNLLVYTTHAGDGPQVEILFHAAFRELSGLASRRPYTFVHGWVGLEALLASFNGDKPQLAQPPYPHPIETERQVHKLYGYIYGDLFFYDPRHRAVRTTVQAFLEFSTCVTTAHDADKMLHIIMPFVQILKTEDPWVMQEIGLLHFRAGRLDQAEYWLQLAETAEHRWLAVTGSFLDATPTQRSDAPPQSDSLPHTQPASTLGDVTRTRHVVLGQHPARFDYGLWHFPLMLEESIPKSYSFPNTLTAQGLVHGGLERAVRDDGWLPLPGTGDLLILTVEMTLLLDYIASNSDLSKYRRFYFFGYTLGRWNFAFGAIRMEGEDSASTRSKAKDLVSRIESSYAAAPDGDPFASLAAEEIQAFFGLRDL
jgi:hypothetical protein